ncbi:MAG: hypothetical protein RIS43_418 [Actinomycetota bacterium]
MRLLCLRLGMTQSQLVKRVIALTVALIVVTPLSVIAAQWQWNRHIERETRNNLIIQNAVADSVPWHQIAAQGVAPETEWRTVTATGHFDVSRQKLWRKQPFNGEPGFIVITPFITKEGDELLVERGWVPADGRNPAASADLQINAQEQDITLRIRQLTQNSEADPTDLPPGQTNSPRTMMSNKTVDGLFELISSQTTQRLTAIPLPELEAGPHLGYVGQWIIIGLSAIGVYITVMRRLRSEYQAREIKSE